MATRRKEGKTLLGVSWKKRHDYKWYGKQLGQCCRKCGIPKPPVTVDEVECGGVAVANDAQLRHARGESLPNYVLSLAWQRQFTEQKIQIDPNFIMASKAAFRAPLVGFGEWRFSEQVPIVVQDATTIYRSIPADIEPFRHHMACCYFCIKLVNDAQLDPTNQAVLQSLAILKEAEGSNAVAGHSKVHAQEMAATMVLAARKLGYYGGGASNLRPA